MSVNVDPCTVERKCSSDGIVCGRNDVACQSRATQKQLEVICTTENDDFLYCPSSTGHADSKAIWVLLFFAVALAVGGTAIAWRVLKSSS